MPPKRSSTCGAFSSISGTASKMGFTLSSMGLICARLGTNKCSCAIAPVIMPNAALKAI